MVLRSICKEIPQRLSCRCMSARRDAADYAISRIDQDSTGTRGWQVRLQRNGVKHSRFFSDSEWGGESKAFATAQQFRDLLLAHAERMVYRRTTVRTQTMITDRNSNGVIGVSRISQTSSNGSEYHFWQAAWLPEVGRRESFRYSVLKFGDEEAFRIACEAREAGLKGETPPNPDPDSES